LELIHLNFVLRKCTTTTEYRTLNDLVNRRNPNQVKRRQHQINDKIDFCTFGLKEKENYYEEDDKSNTDFDDIIIVQHIRDR
jgi:hypothetical protein